MSENARPKADGPRFEGPAEDVEAIRSAHRDWWSANNTTDLSPWEAVERSSRNFAPDTLMFNLNGHTYYGLDEMRPMWAYYANNIDIETNCLWDYRISVYGDVALITSEGIFPARDGDGNWDASNIELGQVGGDTVGIRFRETSFAKRDDGYGNPVWKLWHFHCSVAAPATEQRPGYEDTWESRGGPIGGPIFQTPELPAPEKP